MQVFLHVETAFAVGILIGLVAASAANARAACAIKPPPAEPPATEQEKQEQAGAPR